MKKLTFLSCLVSLLFINLAYAGADANESAVDTNAPPTDTNAAGTVAPPDDNASGSNSDDDQKTDPTSLEARKDIWKEILYGGGFVLVSLVFLYVGKLLFDVVTPFKLDTQLTEKDNPAMGIVLTGYLLAIIIIICGVMMSDGESIDSAQTAGLTFENFTVELIEVAAYTLGGIVLLLLSGVINDKLILNEFSNTHEVSDRKNCGVAVIIAAGFLGSGLIIAGAIQGSLDWISALVGFAIGQMLLVFFGLIYQRATSYDDQKELHERQNLAVGIAFAGNLLAYSLLLMKGLTMSGGEVITLNDQLWHFGYYAVAGAVILPVLRVVNDKLFLPGVNLVDEIVEDRNINAGLLEAGLAVAMAGILIVCM